MAKYIKGVIYATSWSSAKRKAEKKIAKKAYADSLVIKKSRRPKRKRSSAYSYIAQRN